MRMRQAEIKRKMKKTQITTFRLWFRLSKEDLV